jgi:hypothetical protein
MAGYTAIVAILRRCRRVIDHDNRVLTPAQFILTCTPKHNRPPGHQRHGAARAARPGKSRRDHGARGQLASI